jgi:hypothetical protein
MTGFDRCRRRTVFLISHNDTHLLAIIEFMVFGLLQIGTLCMFVDGGGKRDEGGLNREDAKAHEGQEGQEEGDLRGVRNVPVTRNHT